MNLAGKDPSTKYKGPIWLPGSASAESQDEDPDKPWRHLLRLCGRCSRGDEQTQGRDVLLVRTCACFIADPLHDGEVLFLRAHLGADLNGRTLSNRLTYNCLHTILYAHA